MTSAASGICHVVDGVGGLGGRGVVRLGAHAADARGDLRHLLDGTALEELLEAAQLGDDEVGLVDVAALVQEQVDATVALKTGDGIDADAGHERTSSAGSAVRARPRTEVASVKA